MQPSVFRKRNFARRISPLWNQAFRKGLVLSSIVHFNNLNVFLDGFDETVIGDPETDQALAEFDFLADENKSDISDSDSQSKEQGIVK